MRRIEWRSRLFRGEIIFHVRPIVPHEIRPAEIPRFFREVEFIKTGRAAFWISLEGVWPHVAPEKPARFLVDAEPKRIAAAHDVNLGQCFRSAARKEIPI